MVMVNDDGDDDEDDGDGTKEMEGPTSKVLTGGSDIVSDVDSFVKMKEGSFKVMEEMRRSASTRGLVDGQTSGAPPPLGIGTRLIRRITSLALSAINFFGISVG